jgi:hypothetical protein
MNSTPEWFPGVAALCLVGCFAAPAFGQSPAVGRFDGQTDVGTVSRPGAASYDPETQTYTVSGSGANMWAGHDDFHYVWKRMKGDFILRARADFVGKGVEPHRKMGWQIRATLDSVSPHVTAVVHGNGLTSLQFRRAPGGVTEEIQSPDSGADVIQLERHGSVYTMSVARFGDTLTTEQVRDVPLGDEVYVGLFVCAHNDTVTETAHFRNVRITRPVKDGFVPYRDYIGSRLETIDVADGHRTVLLRSPDAIQAPNWTRDGKALIYNDNGRLYRFDLATRTPAEIPTGFAVHNNNDHVISFDGRMLGISDQTEDPDGDSNVYTVPITGGTPHRVTATGPSSTLGWSPVGR